MHDGMPYDPIQGQGQGHETFKVRNSSIFSAIFNVSWQMTTDSETTEQYLTFARSRFLISILVLCHVTTNLEQGNIDSVCKCFFICNYLR